MIFVDGLTRLLIVIHCAKSNIIIGPKSGLRLRWINPSHQKPQGLRNLVAFFGLLAINCSSPSFTPVRSCDGCPLNGV